MAHQDVNLQWKLESKEKSKNSFFIWSQTDFSYKIFVVLPSHIDGTGQGILINSPTRRCLAMRGLDGLCE